MQIFWCEETIFLWECKRLTCMQLNQSVRKNFCGVQSLTCWAPKDVIAVLTLCPERAFISACLIMYCCHGLIKYLLFFYLLTSCGFFSYTLCGRECTQTCTYKCSCLHLPACTHACNWVSALLHIPARTKFVHTHPRTKFCLKKILLFKKNTIGDKKARKTLANLSDHFKIHQQGFTEAD